MDEYTGVFALLAVVPMWAIVLVALVVGIGVPFVVADRMSGLFFNYSYSGMLGDIGLLTVVLIGVTVVQRSTQLPAWFASAWPQTIWLAVCIVTGVLLVTVATPWPTATWQDRYHNAVVVPLFLFFLPLMVLAILYGGSRMEMVATMVLIAIWAGFVVYDFKDGRINQPERLARKYSIYLFEGRFQKFP